MSLHSCLLSVSQHVWRMTACTIDQMSWEGVYKPLTLWALAKIGVGTWMVFKWPCRVWTRLCLAGTEVWCSVSKSTARLNQLNEIIMEEFSTVEKAVRWQQHWRKMNKARKKYITKNNIHKNPQINVKWVYDYVMCYSGVSIVQRNVCRVVGWFLKTKKRKLFVRKGIMHDTWIIAYNCFVVCPLFEKQTKSYHHNDLIEVICIIWGAGCTAV